MTVKRPVGRRESSSKPILTGPLNTYPISRAWLRSPVASSAFSVLAYGASLSWSCWERWTLNSLGTRRLLRDISLASASSSRCKRAAISTGCTSPLNARAKTPLTAPSTFFSKRAKMPMSLLPRGSPRSYPQKVGGLAALTIELEPLAYVENRRLGNDSVVLAFPGWIADLTAIRARVAERQTRWLQVPVSERTWGFKSPLAHSPAALRALVRSMLRHCNSAPRAFLI